jgi:uncharacterized protein (TIGR02145 family)
MRRGHHFIVLYCCVSLGISISGCNKEKIVLHGEITGYVTDAETFQPLQSTAIKLNPLNYKTTTGSDGKFQFKGLAPGNYEIEVSKQSYAKSIQKAPVVSASISQIDFALDFVPVIHFSDTALKYGYFLTSLSVTISKTGPGKLSYLATPSQKWLTVNPSTGSVENESDTLNISIDRSGLTHSNIQEFIVIRSTYNKFVFQDTINVNLLVFYDILFNQAMSYGTLEDIDGNIYKTISIGNQTWMAENLKTTILNDKTPIALVEDNLAWRNNTQPAYCWYKNDENYKIQYGALYNWYTVKTGKLCPKGWHVSTDEEWTILSNSFGGREYAGGKMKEIGLTHWEDPNLGATNSSGFTALPGNFRLSNGIFLNFKGGDWWTPTMSYTGTTPFNWNIEYDNLGCYQMPDLAKSAGLSVRCVKDLSK